MLRILDKSDFSRIYEILEESFPPEEYRPYNKQLELLDREEYKLYGKEDQEGSVIGFLAVWELEEFLFIEHFAVSEKNRNQGIGANLLQQLQKRYSCPMCLEVELPKDRLTVRRIGFYERNGFFLNDYTYEQPSLGAGRGPVPLRIMTSEKCISYDDFIDLRENLYRIVYGVETSATE